MAIVGASQAAVTDRSAGCYDAKPTPTSNHATCSYTCEKYASLQWCDVDFSVCKAGSGLIKNFCKKSCKYAECVYQTDNAGEYDVWYGAASSEFVLKKRPNENLIINCDNSVRRNKRGDRIINKLNFDGVSTKCNQPRDSSATMYILNAFVHGGFECLRKSGTSFVGHAYYANGVRPDIEILVEYRLVKATNCQE